MARLQMSLWDEIAAGLIDVEPISYFMCTFRGRRGNRERSHAQNHFHALHWRLVVLAGNRDYLICPDNS